MSFAVASATSGQIELGSNGELVVRINVSWMNDQLSASQQLHPVDSHPGTLNEEPFPWTSSILRSVSHENHVLISAVTHLFRQGPFDLYEFKGINRRQKDSEF
jgi:hypothetical protein